MTDFLAIDGEALREGPYVLMAASNGARLEDVDGLSTKAILELLLTLHAPRRRLVVYGMNYDVNQWLVSLPRRKLRELWDTGYVVWRDYKLSWTPGRTFSVQAQGGRYAKVSEVVGFFQCSLVQALARFGILAQPELLAGKRDRAHFTAADLPRMRDYCAREVADLAELMRRYAAACERADLSPREWTGAGSLAGAILRAEGVTHHHAYDGELGAPAALEPIMQAYFGGRIEAIRLGSHFKVRSLDLRSAYPFGCSQLPSLQGACLRWRRSYDPGAPHAVYHASFSGVDGAIAPLPVRNNGAIYYPRRGEGFYHACELRAVREAGFDVSIGGGWVLDSSVTPPAPAPFAFLADRFRRRRALERAGDPAASALKLGLNAIWGKLAQGSALGPRPPRWQSYFWAGEATARIRARLLRAACAVAEPMAIATDELIARDSNGQKPANRLGGWRLDRLEAFFQAAAGIYSAEAHGNMIVRSRGHFARELDYGAIREGFETEGLSYVHHYRSRRFVGLGAALNGYGMDAWRTWPKERRSLGFYPRRKVPGPDGVLYPLEGDGLSESEPYVPKGAAQEAPNLEALQALEQPLRDSL